MGKIPSYNEFAEKNSNFVEKRMVFSHAPDPHAAPAEAAHEEAAPPPALEENHSISAQEKRQILEAIEKRRVSELSGADITNSIRNALSSNADWVKKLKLVDQKILGSKTDDIAEKWKELKVEGLRQMRAREEVLREMQQQNKIVRAIMRPKIGELIEEKASQITISDSEAEAHLRAEAQGMESEYRLSAKDIKANIEIGWIFNATEWGKTDEVLAATPKGEKRLKQRIILDKLMKPSDLHDITSGGEELGPELRTLLYYLQDNAFVNGLTNEKTFKKLLDQVEGNPELAKRKKEEEKNKAEAAAAVDKLEKELGGGDKKEQLIEIQEAIDNLDKKISEKGYSSMHDEVSASMFKPEDFDDYLKLKEEKNNLTKQAEEIKNQTTTIGLRGELIFLEERKEELEDEIAGIDRSSTGVTKIEDKEAELAEWESKAQLARGEVEQLDDEKNKKGIDKAKARLVEAEGKCVRIRKEIENIRKYTSKEPFELEADKRKIKSELKKIDREIAEKTKAVEKKETALNEAKQKLEEAEAAAKSAEDEMKAWKEANGDKAKKLSPEEIARAGQAKIFEAGGLGKDTAEHAARLRVNMDVLSAKEGEATKRNLEFLEGSAKETHRTNGFVGNLKHYLTLGIYGAKEDFQSPMRGKNLIENIAKEFKQENHLKIDLNPRGLAKLKLSEEQLVLLFGACTHAVKTEKLDIGDRIALSRLADNAKRLILQKRIGTERENQSIEKIDIGDYMRLAKGTKAKKGEKGKGEGEHGHGAELGKFGTRFIAGGQRIFDGFLGKFAAKKGGGHGDGHGGH
jgi:hypothetical protein